MANATLSPSSELLTRAQAAAYLGLKEQTLASWATLGRYDLPYVRCGRLVRYRKSDLDAFLDRRSVTHTGQADEQPAAGTSKRRAPKRRTA